MASTITFDYGTTGTTLYLFLVNEDGDFWDAANTNIAAFDTGNYGDHDVAFSEVGTTGIYQATVPASLPAGTYWGLIRKQAGGSPAATDNPVGGTLTLAWDGTNLLSDYSIDNLMFKTGTTATTGTLVDDDLYAINIMELISAVWAGKSTVTDNGDGTTDTSYYSRDGSTIRVTIQHNNTTGEWTTEPVWEP